MRRGLALAIRDLECYNQLMARFSFQLEQELLDELRAYAAEHDTSMAAVCRQTLRDFLDAASKKEQGFFELLPSRTRPRLRPPRVVDWTPRPRWPGYYKDGEAAAISTRYLDELWA